MCRKHFIAPQEAVKTIGGKVFKTGNVNMYET